MFLVGDIGLDVHNVLYNTPRNPRVCVEPGAGGGGAGEGAGDGQDQQLVGRYLVFISKYLLSTCLGGTAGPSPGTAPSTRARSPPRTSTAKTASGRNQTCLKAR